MPMFVDAALVTRKAKGNEFNTDSINAAGKIWARERIHSDGGVFAAGRGQDRPYYVLASSSAMGTAESAVQLFNECVKSFDDDCSNVSSMTAEYFKSFISFMSSETGDNSDNCTMAAFIGCGDRVFMAKTGRTKLFRVVNNTVSEVIPQLFDHSDLKSQYGVCSFPEVKQGEIYLLMGQGVSSVLSNDIIEDACLNCDNDVQKLLRKLANAAAKMDAGVAISIVAIKLSEVDSSVITSAASIIPNLPLEPEEQSNNAEDELIEPDNAEAYSDEDISSDNYSDETEYNENTLEDTVADNADSKAYNNEQNIAVNFEPDADVLPEPDAEAIDSEDRSTRKKRATVIILAIMLTVAVLVLAFLIIDGIASNNETTTESTTIETTTMQEEVTTNNNSVVTTEATTEETTVAETTTARASEPTTRRKEPQTAAPTTVPSTKPSTEPSTEASTVPSTEPSTEASTEFSTEPSTEPSTESPTEPSTEASTESSSDTLV